MRQLAPSDSYCSQLFHVSPAVAASSPEQASATYATRSNTPSLHQGIMLHPTEVFIHLAVIAAWPLIISTCGTLTGWDGEGPANEG